MRVTTQKAVEAFNNDAKLTLSNTAVLTDDKKTCMYLFGNLIAVKDKGTNSLKITNAGWMSNTTKERLNGFPNVSINQVKGVWYLNGKEWNGEMTKVK